MIYNRFKKSNMGQEIKRLTVLYYIVYRMLYDGLFDAKYSLMLWKWNYCCFDSRFFIVKLESNKVYRNIKKIGNASLCIYLMHVYTVRVIDKLCSVFLATGELSLVL